MTAPQFDETEYEFKKPARFKKWIPKKWKPEYDRIVALSAVGKSNKEIAEATGYTKEHISNLLNMPEAEALLASLQKRMREKMMVDIPSELNTIAEKTVKLLNKAMDNKELFEKSPFALIDRGLDVVKGLGHLKGGGNGSIPSPQTVPQNVTNVDKMVMVVSSQQADNLMAGLAKADEVKRLHSGENNGTK